MTFPCMRCGERPKMSAESELLYKLECGNCEVAVVHDDEDVLIGKWNRRYGEQRSRTGSKYVADHAKASAADASPTKEAAWRAAATPLPGDRWSEMLSSWFHVVSVKEGQVTVRLYVGPCKVVPGEAHEEWVMPAPDFEAFIRRQGARFMGNALWVCEDRGSSWMEGYWPTEGVAP